MTSVFEEKETNENTYSTFNRSPCGFTEVPSYILEIDISLVQTLISQSTSTMFVFHYKILCFGFISLQILFVQGGGSNPEEQHTTGGVVQGGQESPKPNPAEAKPSWTTAVGGSFTSLKDHVISFTDQNIFNLNEKFKQVIVNQMNSMDGENAPLRPFLLSALKFIIENGLPIPGLAKKPLIAIIDQVSATYTNPEQVAQIEKKTKQSSDTTDLLLYKLMAENIDDDKKAEFLNLGKDSETVKKMTYSFLNSLKKVIHAHVENYVTRMEDNTDLILKNLSGQKLS